MSAVLDFLMAVYTEHGGTRGLSVWMQRVNAALGTCIDIGMRFDEDDLVTLKARMGGDSWRSAWDAAQYEGGMEHLYSRACNPKRLSNHTPNTSAARAIEKLEGWPPIIVDGARLYVGASFQWAGETWEVSSRRDDGFNLLRYTVPEKQPERCAACGVQDWMTHQKARGQKRMTVTYDELRAAETAKRAAKKASKTTAGVKP